MNFSSDQRISDFDDEQSLWSMVYNDWTIVIFFQYEDGGLHGGYLEGGGGGAGLYDPHGNARGVGSLHHSPHLGGMAPAAHPQYPPPPQHPNVLSAASATVPDAHVKRDKDAIYG